MFGEIHCILTGLCILIYTLLICDHSVFLHKNSMVITLIKIITLPCTIYTVTIRTNYAE